jgi:pantoate--beta-alanine ligase
MLIFKKIAELQEFLSEIKARHKSVGFVPTMGALHQGHLSLIATSKQQCDVTICSIFVNPTQFNDKNDLDRYPRMPDKDIALLQSANCDAVFLPSAEEIYPSEEKGSYDFGYLDKILEGEFRPGHFNGVAQVVKRFFDIIRPTKAFFGSKDYQQVMIVKALVKQIQSPVEIIACPILREADGLAMSSRNALLSDEERKVAGLIPKLLKQANSLIKEQGIAQAKAFIQQEISKEMLMKLDYFEICDMDNLVIVSDIQDGKNLISLLAVFVGKIRLIDNFPVD